ncbi:MAG: hypothetical protein IAE89_09940 [Anaerolineae bacterium]|nr:hypothetical protein [Anaerolineae bacterium]
MTAPPDFLLIGHFTADLTPEGRIAGGTVSYAVRTAAAFGLRVAILTSSVVDEPLLAELTPYAEVISLPAEQTTTYENIYTPAGRVQYVRGVAAPITAADIPDSFKKARLVHFAPIAGELDPRIAFEFPDAWKLLTLQGWLRRWDQDGRVHFRRFDQPEAITAIGTVVFSEEDIVEAPDIEHEYAHLVDHLVVTRAERGGTYYQGGVPETYLTPQVALINQTGAGDVFASALLASLPSLNYDFRKALKVGAELASISVTRVGLASAPNAEEAAAAIKRACE